MVNLTNDATPSSMTQGNRIMENSVPNSLYIGRLELIIEPATTASKGASTSASCNHRRAGHPPKIR